MLRPLSSLRTKLIALALLPLLALGVSFLSFTLLSLRETLTRELLEKGRFMARHGAEMSGHLMQSGDLPALSSVLRTYLTSDSDMRYAYVVKTSGEVVAHTFKGGFPEALPGSRESRREVAKDAVSLAFEGEETYDIAAPFAGGDLGVLHLGLSREHVSDTVTSVLAGLLGTGAALLLAGAGTAFFLSHRVTRPLEGMAETARRIGGGDLGSRVDIRTGDELGELAATVNTMAESLQATMVSREEYREQKRFLESVFQSIRYPFLVVDAETREVLMANAAAGEAGEGRTCHELAGGGDGGCADNDSCLISLVAASGKPVLAEQTRRGRGGEERVLEIHGHPVLNREGRLVQVIKYSVDVTDRRTAQEEREKLIAELTSALADVKRLEGLLPICSGCKRIRDDRGYWQQVEIYVAERSEAKFSHGVCPDCSGKLYGQVLG